MRKKERNMQEKKRNTKVYYKCLASHDISRRNGGKSIAAYE